MGFLVRGRGFTLIELLVVIAIIGLLASIVLSSVSAARARGRDAKRVADLQQVIRVINLNDNAETSTSFTNSGGTSCNSSPAHSNIANCVSPNLTAFADPSGGAAVPCTSSGPAVGSSCQYAVSKTNGTAGATFNDWQINAYLQDGSIVGLSGPTIICVSNVTTTIMVGAATNKCR